MTGQESELLSKFAYDLGIGVLSGIVSGLIVAFILSRELKKQIKAFRIGFMVFVQLAIVVIVLIVGLFFLLRYIKIQGFDTDRIVQTEENLIHHVNNSVPWGKSQ